jgi:hypothetical protein
MAVLDWQCVFYVTGGLTLTWYAFWCYLVYDSPAQHPWISNAERNYLERVIGDSVTSHKVFREILRGTVIIILLIKLSIEIKLKHMFPNKACH